MAKDPSDKLDNVPSGRAAVEEPLRPGHRRLRPQVWPMDTGESEDTFATPSENGAGDINPETLSGPEPAVFGGANPSPSDEEAAQPEQENTQPLGTALDESVSGNDMLADAPQVNVARLVRTTPFLLGSMIACLIGSTFFIRMAVPTETYVQTSIQFQNYQQLNDIEAQDLQAEMSSILRTYPLRARAWEVLQKKSPGVLPGFLNSGLTFHRLDAIEWQPNGTVRLRIESEDPASDITRLSAVTDAFHVELQGRIKKLDAYKASLGEQQSLLAANLVRDAQLKTRIDELLDDANRYDDLKQALQSMERYLEVADESNPLRLIARQNLQRISIQAADARELSLERDEMLGQRIALQKQAQGITQEVTRLNRAIEVFAYPEAPNPATLRILDTRAQQKFILRSTWIGVILLFAGIIVFLHIADHRAAEKYRRERREMLKLQPRAAQAKAPVAP